MRVVKVHLRNLNSLRGDHSVDFASEPIASAGIFAITGPTGAGKTTLLDAITLALYGRAARYANESNPENMMSRHTGECRAEVEFEVAGERYRATWELRRSRKSPGGNIQPARRFLYDAAGVVLADKVRDVDQRVEELCGLDYGRFMRSALLAQGEFAKFLKAKPNERAALLESLTGTQVFSELGKLAHEETGRRENEIAMKEGAIGNLTVLGDPERANLESLVGDLQAKLTAARARRARYEKEVNRASRLRDEVEALEKIRQSIAELELKRGNAHEQLRALEMHRKLARLIPDLDRLKEEQNEVRQLQNSLEAVTAKADDDQSKLNEAVCSAIRFAEAKMTDGEKARDEARREITKADRNRKDAEVWLEKHRADGSIRDVLGAISRAGTSFDHLRDRMAELRGRLKTGRKNLKQLQSQIKSDERGLAKAKEVIGECRDRSKELVREVSRLLNGRSEAEVRADLGKMLERKHQMEQLKLLKDVCDNARQKVVSAHERIEKVGKDLERASQSAERCEARRKAAADMLAAHRSHLETARMAASYEEQRAELKQGEVCPLCGATEHPFADGEFSAVSKLKEIDARVRESVEKLEVEESDKRKSDDLVAKAKAEKLAISESLRESEQELRSTLGKIEKLSADSGISQFEPDDIRGVERDISLCQLAIEKVRKAQGIVAAAEKDEQIARSNLERMVIEIKSKSVEVARLQAEDEAIGKDLAVAEEKWGEVAAELDLLLRPLGLGFLDPDASDDCAPEEGWRLLLEHRSKRYLEVSGSLDEATALLSSLQEKETQAVHSIDEFRTWRDSLQQRVPEWDVGIDRSGSELRYASRPEAQSQIETLEKCAREAVVVVREKGNRLKEAQGRLESFEASLGSKLKEAGFASVALANAARLPDRKLEEAVETEQYLDTEGKRLGAQSEVHAKTIETLRLEGAAEGAEFSKLRELRVRAEKEADDISDKFANAKESLTRDDRDRKRLKELDEQLGAGRKQLDIWKKLRGLIGSSDGSKFSRYAQGVSLDILVGHANRHLARLSDRYSVRRVVGVELELEIVDGYQGGATRPMTSLSGGESFLVSLALALGLSDLAGRNVRIDSLFIDEGFGALDAETLDVAISALDSLRLDQKSVGVISHIDLLKERIATQVVVEKNAGGVGKVTVVST